MIAHVTNQPKLSSDIFREPQGALWVPLVTSIITAEKNSPCKHRKHVSKHSNPIISIHRGNIVGKDQSCPQTLSLSLRSVVGSTEPDVNWRALKSNKTAKPGWYRAYCRSHPVWSWPVCLSFLASVYICLGKPDIYKGLLWNRKSTKTSPAVTGHQR